MSLLWKTKSRLRLKNKIYFLLILALLSYVMINKFLKKIIGQKQKEFTHVLEHKKIKHGEIKKSFKDIVEKNDAEGLIVKNNSIVPIT